jgi:hypothetical protein
MMNDKTLEILQKNEHRKVFLKLDFPIVHNIIATLNDGLITANYPDDLKETLTYCNLCIINQTLVQMPECATIYLKGHHQTEERLNED